MSLPFGLPLGLPILSFVGNGLEGTGFILGPDAQAQGFADMVGVFNQRFFASASGSVTSTRPCLRLRLTVPVWHQVRECCQLQPASRRTTQIVKVLTCGKPSSALRK